MTSNVFKIQEVASFRITGFVNWYKRFEGATAAILMVELLKAEFFDTLVPITMFPGTAHVVLIVVCTWNIPL
jgi:hypothetical protein